MFTTPISVTQRSGVIAQIGRALGWPARVAAAREARARLAELSERERQDILPGRWDDAEAAPTQHDYDAGERADRARAIRAWYRSDARAA
jgi:hypothetical protein